MWKMFIIDQKSATFHTKKAVCSSLQELQSSTSLLNKIHFIDVFLDIKLFIYELLLV